MAKEVGREEREGEDREFKVIIIIYDKRRYGQGRDRIWRLDVLKQKRLKSLIEVLIDV